ncbi:hypothetical protein Mnod_0194 [Methylobacterium nodulans ORS 2060]|uniref:Uncharacterized protein n=1 Tax=Methylobacterium nodulans (strain LMG 21967 / CNCM I-2342 / ORS 2060) TaxID=460265 RepID=B8I9I6_METNO|nr:hypothetical protein Mnod_0194 [Methylobacterium nodulans ORS 2060]
MCDTGSLRVAQRRAALRPGASRRRGLALHRPRPPVWSRMSPTREGPRASDLVLAMLGVTLLGGLALMASIDLLGRGLAQH